MLQLLGSVSDKYSVVTCFLGWQASEAYWLTYTLGLGLNLVDLKKDTSSSVILND